MEQHGYVSGFDGSKPRRVLIKRSEYEALFGDGTYTEADAAEPPAEIRHEPHRCHFARMRQKPRGHGAHARGCCARRGTRLYPLLPKADVLIVNTCGFIEPAKQESIDTILEMAAYKRTGRCRLLVATGCLTERYRKELAEAMPEIDLLLGVREYDRLPGLIARALALPQPPAICGAPRVLDHPALPRVPARGRTGAATAAPIAPSRSSAARSAASDRNAARRGKAPGRRRRDGADRHRAGYLRLRGGFVRAAAARRAAATAGRHRRAALGCACSTPIPTPSRPRSSTSCAATKSS